MAPARTDIVALIEAYFDESGSHDGSPVLCIAGFVFTSDACLKLDAEWKAVLDKYGLPFFHMVDCAHGTPPFNKLTRDQRIAAEKEMIGIIRKHLLFGMGVSLCEDDFYEVFPNGYGGQSAYTWCCWTAISVIHHWIAAHHFDGRAAYFFEAGHKKQGEANALMQRIFDSPDLRRQYCYGGHAFADKKQARPLQAADILAWLQANQAQRYLRGSHDMRKDYAALMDNQPIEAKFVTRHHLLIMREQVRILMEGGPQITGIFGSIPLVST
jgi:hypothetical protein